MGDDAIIRGMTSRNQPIEDDFPPLSEATEDGLLAVGGDLSAERLVAAYRRGIFPWFNPGQPILWWSPDPRMVLFPDELRISRSLRRTLRRGAFTYTMDADFRAVIDGCAGARRRGGGGSWITAEMIDAYVRLHELGIAHSIETRLDGRVAGGLYGVAMGGVFFGESMFSLKPDASKCALAVLAGFMRARGDRVIDCQVPSRHLESLGARSIARRRFVRLLEQGLDAPRPARPWEFDETLVRTMT